MKKLILLLTVFIVTLSFTTTTQASDWFGGNGGQWKQGPYGMYWEENNWPVWTPMYWMEEFTNNFDNNSWDSWGNWGGNNWGSNNYGNYGIPNGGYNINPYQYNYPYGNYIYPQMPAVPTVPAQ